MDCRLKLIIVGMIDHLTMPLKYFCLDCVKRYLGCHYDSVICWKWVKWPWGNDWWLSCPTLESVIDSAMCIFEWIKQSWLLFIFQSYVGLIHGWRSSTRLPLPLSRFQQSSPLEAGKLDKFIGIHLLVFNGLQFPGLARRLLYVKSATAVLDKNWYNLMELAQIHHILRWRLNLLRSIKRWAD